MVSNDENSLAATDDAFALLNYLVGIRLKRGLLTVVDATNVQAYARKQLIALAREHHVLCVAIALNLPAAVCEARNSHREDRNFGKHVVRQHTQQLKKSLRGLRKEGFQHVCVLGSEDEYLRIIYGPEYDLSEHLAQLKQRGLSRKRSMALREFALGIEGLERFVNREPLRRVHKSVFGVLALESESVDPRL